MFKLEWNEGTTNGIPSITEELHYEDKIVPILRQEVGSRGGGIEIDLSPFGFKGEKMAAYQNYLGGGMLGSVQCNDTIRSQSQRPFMDEESERLLDTISEHLKRFYHGLTNPDTEWEGMTFEDRQKLPSSAY